MWHQTQIELLNEKRRLRAAVLEKTISGIIWSVIVAGGAVIWKGILAMLAKGG
jgi:hypothetical protein